MARVSDVTEAIEVPDSLVDAMTTFLGYVTDAMNLARMTEWGAWCSIDHNAAARGFIEMSEQLDSTGRAVRTLEEAVATLGRSVGVELPDDQHGQGPHAEPAPLPTASELEHFEAMAGLAETERARGFPMLCSHSLIGLWSALEAFVDDFCACIIEGYPECMNAAPITNVRVPVVSIWNVEGHERALAVVRALKQQKQPPSTSGLAGFEWLLAQLQPTGRSESALNGDINGAVKETLMEAHQVRNLLVHRKGIIDVTFKRNRPKSPLHVGDRVLVSFDDLFRVFAASRIYSITVTNRLMCMLGAGPLDTDLLAIGYNGAKIPEFEAALAVRYPGKLL